MGVCGWTICVTCNKYILHANCNSLMGIKGGQMNKSANWSQPENAIPATRNLPPSRTPVLAAAQQQADKTIAHSQHPLKIHTHPHPHFTIHNTRSRQRQLLPVCLPLWLQLLVPVPPFDVPLLTGLQTRSQSPSSFPLLPALPPDPQRAINAAAVAYIVGLWFLPSTDRSQQTNWHSLDSNEQGQGRGAGERGRVPHDRR